MTRRSNANTQGLRLRLRLQTQLLALLLVFAAVPLLVAVVVGYRASRAAMIEQAEGAVRELARYQTGFLETEIRRQRLLLRTIIGQLATAINRSSAEELSQLLASSLADDGVFDGLRLLRSTGEIVANVALRPTAPQWPVDILAESRMSAEGGAVLHRDRNRVVAYILGAPLRVGDDGWWLEGHVPSNDFGQLFDLPLHAMGGMEIGIFERDGKPVVVPHSHAAAELAPLFEGRTPDSLYVTRGTVAGVPSVVLTAPIAEPGWLLAASLPLDIVLAPVARLRNAAVIGCSLLIVIIFVAARLAARYVTTPLRELSVAASDFAQKGTYQRVRNRGVAETDALIESFSHMATTLQQSREEIDELHAKELQRAQQLATVGELASGVAHEVRNPLTGVLGALEVAARRLPPDDAALPMLMEARAQLQRIESTTTRLLEYARPPEIRVLVVDANGLAERATRVVEAKARLAGVDLTVEPAPSNLSVRVDPELLVQVLVNLLLNGIEAMTDGGQLTISVSGDGDSVGIAVQDAGPGIASEHQSDIFRPFFTTKHQGTGLGLSISHQIVTRHGGSLRVDAAAHHGTTFVVSLPLAEDERGDQ